jgi:serine/threonine-protein kinase RIO1
MVRLWAEKEMRNLKRLVSAGIRCPDPLEVRENVLVMTFLGDKEGWQVYCYIAILQLLSINFMQGIS